MTKTNSENDEFSYLLTLYNSAINQNSHEGNLIWQRFQAYLIAHTIFFTLLTQIILHERYSSFIILLRLCTGIGELFALFWLLSTIRGFESLLYWNYAARELEEIMYKRLKTSDSSMKYSLFKRGYRYFIENKVVLFDFGYSHPMTLSRGCLTKNIPYIKTVTTAYFSIIAIAIFYIVIFIYSFYPANY